MRLAIDFGTSYTKLGYLENGRFVNLAGIEGHIPSVVTYLPSTGKLYFGDLALRLHQPDAITVRFFKLELKRNLTFTLGSFSLQDIMRSFFEFLRLEYLSSSGQSLQAIALSVPNYFGLKARRILINAAREALNVESVYLLPEPVAALLGHNQLFPREPLEGEILSIDIGGGTTDFSFLSLGGRSKQLLLETQLQVGNDAFSGSELDRGVLRHIFFPAFLIQTGNPVPSQLLDEKELRPRDRYRLNRLMQAAETARIELGLKGSSYLNIPDFYAGQSLLLTLESEFFDIQLKPVFDRFRDYFELVIRNRAEALDLYRPQGWKLDYVLLLGGASLTRGVADLIISLCPGVMLISPPERDLAVVRGLCTWMEEALENHYAIKSIYPFDFYIEKNSNDSAATSLEKIPFDTGNLELDLNETYPVFSFPLQSAYNLAPGSGDFHCRVYEVAEEEGQATPERFLGQEIVLGAELGGIRSGEIASLYLNLKESCLELRTGEMGTPEAIAMPDWWRDLPQRQITAAELMSSYPFIDQDLKKDFTAHLLQQNQSSRFYKDHATTAFYKILYLLQFLRGK